MIGTKHSHVFDLSNYASSEDSQLQLQQTEKRHLALHWLCVAHFEGGKSLVKCQTVFEYQTPDFHMYCFVHLAIYMVVKHGPPPIAMSAVSEAFE